MCHCVLQVLVVGKISQAVVVAGAAYLDEKSFSLSTGILKSRLVDDKGHTDTQVSVELGLEYGFSS